MGKKIRIILLLLVISIGVFAILNVIKKPPVTSEQETNKIQFQKQGELTFTNAKGKSISTIEIEIADSEIKREIGLMKRDSMALNQGMLFIAESPYVQGFWMKDTILPLDMLFADPDGKIVHIQKNATPFSENIISSEVPALYVVEVNAGYCDQWNIQVGDSFTWRWDRSGKKAD